MAIYSAQRYGPPDIWQRTLPRRPTPPSPQMPKAVAPDNWMVAQGLAPTASGIYNNQPAPVAPTGSAAPAKPKPNYDYSSDPILQSFDASSVASRRKREAGDQESIKAILLGLGSQALAREMLGNDPFVDAISDDPDSSSSALAQLGYGFRSGKRDLIEDMNNQNLFYGGYHADQQRELSRNRLLQEAGLLQGARGQLRDISAQFEQFLDQQRMSRVQAEQDAYQRAIAAALNSGSDGAAAETGNQAAPASSPAKAAPTAAPASGAPTLEDLVKKYSRGSRQYQYA